jgi:HPt (histidine-containing phosphotransfer) domain-containing protein
MSERSHTSMPVFDRASLLRRVGGDEELLKVIVGVFVDDAPASVRRMQAAFDGNDVTALHLAAHALKGASATISAEALRTAADSLEQLAAGSRTAPCAPCLAAVQHELDLLMPVLADVLHRASTEPC